jgi:2Fe-2S ferredoxin
MTTLRMTFIEPDGTVREVTGIAAGRTVMDVAREHAVAGILADCGGSCSCATCHVLVDPAWTAAVGPPNDIEASLLDMIEAAEPARSRLSCQIVLEPPLDNLKVTVLDNA